LVLVKKDVINMPIIGFSKGFTLMEILLVVLIVSIMTAVGANIINSQSIERMILNQAQKFDVDLTFICEKAVFENQAFGIEFYTDSYQVLRYQQPQWLLIESQSTPTMKDEIAVDLLLDGLIQEFETELGSNDEPLPHIICQSDGSFNAFELRFRAAQGMGSSQENKTYYALHTQSPWQIEGAWYQP
jgi:prepilin-type N-terminal cleavage/methylation domain-containing protein